DVAVMVLDGFLLKLGAFLGVKPEAFVAVVMFGTVFEKFAFEMFEERFVAVGLLAVRSARGVHLEEAKVDTQLDFLLAVFSLQFSNYDLACLVIPRFEQVRNIEI